MSLSGLRIIIDEREKKSGIPALLKAAGVGTEVRVLPVGDYIVAPETIVERKSIHDFVSSVFDGRLYDQCERLKEHYASPVILIEGNVDGIAEIAENPLVFYGAVSRIVVEFKIPVVPTPSAEHSARLLVAMCGIRRDVRGPFLKRIRKSGDVQKQQLSTLASLPGVGEKLAVRMLERFGTPLRAFNASSSELAKIGGLGGARAKKIRDMLEKKSRHHKKEDQKTL